MFEDLARNLEVPHALGMTTVLVVPERTARCFAKAGNWKGAMPPMWIMSPTIWWVSWSDCGAARCPFVLSSGKRRTVTQAVDNARRSATQRRRT